MELTVDNKTDMIQTKVRIALVCFPEQSENGANDSFTVLPILLIISVSCLALTLLVYFVVPDLRLINHYTIFTMTYVMYIFNKK